MQLWHDRLVWNPPEIPPKATQEQVIMTTSFHTNPGEPGLPNAVSIIAPERVLYGAMLCLRLDRPFRCRMARLGVVGQVFHLASNSLNQHVRRSFSNSLTVIARLEIAPIVYTRNLGLHWQLRLLSRSHHNSKRTNKTVKRYLKSLTLATNLNKEVPVFLSQPSQDVLFFLLY